MTFDRPTLVTITAPTASGKNFLRDRIEADFGWKRIVSTTTRAPRAGEVNGEDYHFISNEESRQLENLGEFAELIEFRGVRYGVTNAEMSRKMSASVPPMVILEPQGLLVYKKLCVKNGWDIFSIYVSVVESERIRRLNARTVADLAVIPMGADEVAKRVTSVVQTHTDRLLSITGDERLWSHVNTWDAILPGDDIQKALAMLKQGVIWRNHKNKPPAPYTHVV